MGLKIPYDGLTLQIALLGLSNKPELMKKMEKFAEDRKDEDKLLADKAELNKRVAASNGIDVTTLINSPNYQSLLTEYCANIVKQRIEECKKETGMSDKEAWALVAMTMGLIKI